MWQLSNATHYCKLSSDPTTKYAAEVKKGIDLLFSRGLIDCKIKEFLTPHSPRAAGFYLLSKIHKPGHPGRPIVASNGAPTERISLFVDHFLKSCLARIPSYIRDINDFLSKSRMLHALPSHALLVTLDVASLYTNIPHQEGITAREESLNSRADPSPLTDDLCHLIKLIFSTNSFTFNKEYYLQVLGTAMGTCMTPSYANLFMGKLECEFLQTKDEVPLVWWRYTDDIFAVWTHGEEPLCLFVEKLNLLLPHDN